MTIRQQWSYFKYVIRHKWFVLVAMKRIKGSLWRALVHDLSKCRPSEWKAYVTTFYAPDGSGHYKESLDFSYAWNFHQKRNPHHWQFWLLKPDGAGNATALPMPYKYVLEMVADWMGAGKAKTGKWNDVHDWYEKEKDSIVLHHFTKIAVEVILWRL